MFYYQLKDLFYLMISIEESRVRTEEFDCSITWLSVELFIEISEPGKIDQSEVSIVKIDQSEVSIVKTDQSELTLRPTVYLVPPLQGFCEYRS